MKLQFNSGLQKKLKRLTLKYCITSSLSRNMFNNAPYTLKIGYTDNKLLRYFDIWMHG